MDGWVDMDTCKWEERGDGQLNGYKTVQIVRKACWCMVKCNVALVLKYASGHEDVGGVKARTHGDITSVLSGFK
jgi:hypothetical protein